MRVLKLSVAGVRGIVGETLGPGLLVGFGQAFGTYLEGGRVLLSRDTRRSGPTVCASVRAGLMSAGCAVVDLGICPTAALQLAVKQSFAAGGIAVTAGHNDIRWNALKFIRDDGIFLNPRQSEELLDLYHLGQFRCAKWDELRPLESDPTAAARHLQAVLGQVDRERIAARKLTVAVDCANGAVSEFAPRLLGELGCKVVAINTEADLPFPHPPQPSRENLGQLKALVLATGADVGFAHDADGDRLGVVCENGDLPGEETTVEPCAEMILRRGDAGPVVTNLSTTTGLADIARRYGRELIRTRIGQAYITEAALNYGAALAGEGSGGIVFPRLNFAHDSLAAMAHILEMLAGLSVPLSEFVREELPHYAMRKTQVTCPSEKAYTVLEQLREAPLSGWAEERNLEDGLLLRGEGKWVHVRVSQTEPMIRIIAEAREEAAATALAEEYVTKVRREL